MDMLLTTTLGKFWATIDVGVGLSSKRVFEKSSPKTSIFVLQF